jgi:hypothetical protein
MAKKLSSTQKAVMTWMSRGWKAYSAGGTRVEINGKPVGTVSTMTSLETMGLVTKLGVSAWEVTDAGRALNPHSSPPSNDGASKTEG